VTEESILSYYMFTKHVMCPVTGMEIAYAMFRGRSWEGMGISTGLGSGGAMHPARWGRLRRTLSSCMSAAKILFGCW
jgi:hypothetical protein